MTCILCYIAIFLLTQDIFYSNHVTAVTFVPLVLAFHPISLDQNLPMIPQRINSFLLTKCHMSSKLGPLSPDTFLSMKVHINVLLARLISDSTPSHSPTVPLAVGYKEKGTVDGKRVALFHQ